MEGENRSDEDCLASPKPEEGTVSVMTPVPRYLGALVNRHPGGAWLVWLIQLDTARQHDGFPVP